MHNVPDIIQKLCRQRLGRVLMCDEIPPFLTVEEAGRLLRIGRTKAYALTQEWRDTDGRSGLPVVDLGDLLRVPGPAIEEMLHTGLPSPAPSGTPTGCTPQRRVPNAAAHGGHGSAPPDAPVAGVSASANGHQDEKRPAPRTRRRKPTAENQLPLFHAVPTPCPDSQDPSLS
jgi:hypothetical protein